jgi:aryl-alcohol dehydrogenase-like predicted oxidoreductase
LAPDDWRRESPRFRGENFARNLAVVEQIHAIASEKGCTPSQLALAWILERGANFAPIPGTTSPARLRENVGSTGVRIGPQDLERIEAAAPRGIARGERYHPQMMGLLNG